MADETFHHLATERPRTLRNQQEMFGDKDIQTNMDWEGNELLDISNTDQINPLLDLYNVHDIHLTDPESEGVQDVSE